MTRAAVAATTVPLADLAEDWYTELRARNKSPLTIRAYTAAVSGYLAWYAAQGPAEPVLDRKAVNGYLDDLLAAGKAPLTARLRYAALRQFSKWLAREGETETDLLAGLSPPQAPEPEVDGVAEDDLARMIRACRTGPRFLALRDEAIIRVLAETGLRAGECVALTVDDVNTREGTLRVVKAKGGKFRTVFVSPETCTALNRYLRLRGKHKLSGSPALWLPFSGKSLGYQGVNRALHQRAEAAGLKGFHLHRLRHGAASRWLAAGGSEGGLMANHGWSDRSMLDRYVKDTAAMRAMEEARRLGLGRIG
jgi:integrase/recombinase XerD